MGGREKEGIGRGDGGRRVGGGGERGVGRRGRRRGEGGRVTENNLSVVVETGCLLFRGSTVHRPVSMVSVSMVTWGCRPCRSVCLGLV